MKVRVLFLFVIIVSLVASSCSTREIRHRLNEVEQCVQLSPDSALRMLYGISQKSLTTNSLQAKYALLHAKLLYKNFIDTTDLSIIAPAVNYYPSHGALKDKMETFYYHGCILQNRGAYSDAVICLTDALALAEQINDSFTAGLISASLSVLYNNLHNYSEQLLYADKAVKQFEMKSSKDYIQYAQILQGIAHHNLRHYQEAETIYKEMLNKGHPDAVNRQDALAHLALTQASRPDKKVDEAEVLFAKVLDETGSLPSRNMWGAYAYILDRKGRREDANKIYARLDTSDIVNYGWYALTLYERKQYQKAYDYLSASISHQSEILNIALSQATMKAHRERAVQQQNKAEKDARIQRIIYSLAIALLLVVFALMFLLIWRRYERTRDESIRLKELTERIHRQLKEVESKMISSSSVSLEESYIRLYQSRFKEMGILYERLCYAERHGSEAQVILSEVKRMLKGIQMDSGGSRRFEDMIDEQLDGIMAQFRKDFPRRSEKDYRLMSFIIAGFDANTTAFLLGLPSTAAVHMRKSRLKAAVMSSNERIINRYLKFF
ncbi:MAG: hypothetical protein J6Y45_06005 [Bacteroidales bacterium]|nr:hypothetical protein [Bacteroidales bacterium]